MKALERMVQSDRRVRKMLAEGQLMENLLKMIEREKAKKQEGDVRVKVRLLELIFVMIKWGVSIQKEDEIYSWAEEMEGEANRRREKREEEEGEDDAPEVNRRRSEAEEEEENEWGKLGEIAALIMREKIRKEKRKNGEKIATPPERGESERKWRCRR